MKKLLFLSGMMFLLFYCTKIEENNFITQNSVTINDSTIFNIGGDTNVFHLSFNPTINAYYTDSSKHYFDVNVSGPTINVEGPTINQGDISFQINDTTIFNEGDVVIQINDTTINNNNTTVNQGDININNLVQVDGDSLTIQNNNYQIQQNSCPFDHDHCIIRNCRFHHHWGFIHIHC